MPSPAKLQGRAVTPEGLRNVSIEWDPSTARILAVEPSEDPFGPTIIYPGFIDAHVHARAYPLPLEPTRADLTREQALTAKETFASAGQAAIRGGVTRFAAMPNDPNPPSDRDTYERKRQLAEESPCPVIVFAVAVKSGSPWADVPYKVYLDAEPSSTALTVWDDVADVVERYSRCRLFFHAEDPEILRKNPSDGPRWVTRPAEAELSAVRRILELCAKRGSRTHICHISTKAAVEAIADFNRSSSNRVTCEVTPHHLFFSVNDGTVTAALPGATIDPMFLGSNPPLRTEEDRLFLLSALAEGAIDMIATDHAPHTISDKIAGAPGTPHLDTLGGFVTWLAEHGGFSPERLAEILSGRPADLFAPDLTGPYGRITVGGIAEFTILDMGNPTSVLADGIAGAGPFRTKCGWSPFQGLTFPGRAVSVVIQGRSYTCV